MAANPERGEVDVTIGGQVYTLVTTFNALIQLQKACSVGSGLMPIEQILQRAAEGDLEMFRSVFWATLRAHHPDITVEQAGDLIDRAGGIVALNAMLEQVMTASGPDARDVEALNAGARPRRATGARRPRRVGTGERSISVPAGPGLNGSRSGI